MNRTTPDLVGGIIELDETIDIDPFIYTANQLVTEICAPEGLDDERLELIERYLAAHFYTLRDPRPTSEAAGGVSSSYQSSVALFFKTSHYGQMAMLLDTGGGLAALAKQTEVGGKRTLTVAWVGTTPPKTVPVTGRRTMPLGS